MTQENDAIDGRTPEDVSAEQQQAAGDDPSTTEPPERDLSERERAMAEIAQQYRDHHGYGDPEDDDDPDAAAAADDGGTEQDPDRQDAGEDGEPDEAAAQDDPLKELGYYRKPDGKLYTTMKVNGQEREVPADQVKAYLQKDLAGDVKLQQAADRERQLTQREQQLRNLEQQLRQQSSHPPSQQGDEEIRQQAKSVLSKVWDGDDDAAAEALADFIRQNSARVDTDQILSEAERRAMTAVEQREAQRQQREWEQSTREGINWLRETHPDILDDDDLREFVDVRTARMVEARENGDPEFADMTPRQIIEKAAGEANDWLKKQAQQLAGDTPGNAREQRKRNLKPMPRGMSTQPSQKAPEEPDNSPAAAIARMREARAVN